MSSSSMDNAVTHVCRTLRTEFETMRRSLTCSICMSTYVDPVTLSSCVHAFCRTCITQALRSTQQKCPLCLATCSRRSLTAAPELAVAVRCYKTATRAFGLAPATYTDAIPMTQLPAVDEPPQVDMVTAHDELLAARTFSKYSKESDYIQQEQRDIVAVNQRFLLQSAVQQEPSLSQIRQEAQNQHAADMMHSDSSDIELDDADAKDERSTTAMPSQAILDALDQPSPLSSPFASNSSPIPRNRVRNIVEEMERRTSLQQHSSPLVMSSPCTVARPAHHGAPSSPFQSNQSGTSVANKSARLPTATCENESGTTRRTELMKQLHEGITDDSSSLVLSIRGLKVPMANQQDHAVSLASALSSNTDDCKPAFVEPTPQPPRPRGDKQIPDDMIEADDAEEDVKMPYILEPASRSSVHCSSSQGDRTDSETPAIVEPTPVAAALPPGIEERIPVTIVETKLPTSMGVDRLQPPQVTGTFNQAGAQGPASAPANLVVDTNMHISSAADFVTPTAAADLITVGTIVEVQCRTWPGINQLGGVATILAVHNDTSILRTTYDVQYVLDRRKERGVESQYVKLDEVIDSASKGRVSEDSTSSRNQRRKCNHQGLPPELLSELKSQGFDITGEQTTRILSARNNNANRGKRKSKEKQSTGKKRQKSPRYAPSTSSGATTVNRPRWTAAAKCKKADENYDKMFSKALKKGVLYVCTSGLSEAENTMLKELARAVKSTNVRLFIADGIQDGKTALCIVPATVAPRSVSHNTFAARRTMKTMQASLLGIPLVSSKWINVCLEKKQVLPPESTMFIRSLPTKRTDAEAHYGVALLAALGREAHAIFPGVSVYLCGFSQKNANVFRGLLHDAGVEDVIVSKQTAIARVRALQAPATLVLLCDTNASEAISEALGEAIHKQKENIAVVDSPWLVDSVSCGFALDPSDYPPKKGKAKALWVLTKSRSFAR